MGRRAWRRGGARLPRPVALGAITAFAVVALSLSCASPPPTSTGAPPLGELGIGEETAGSAPAARAGSRSTFSETIPLATTTTLPPGAIDGAACTSLPTDVAIDPARDPARHLPSTASWGSPPIPGSQPLLADPAGPQEIWRFDVRGIGSGDVVVISVEPTDSSELALVVVGHLDPVAGSFRRITVLDDCRVRQVRGDDASAWLLASDTLTRVTTLLELELASGTTRWTRDADPRSWELGVDEGVVHVGVTGGTSGLESTVAIAAGTGEVLGEPDVAEAVQGRVIDSDVGLWVVDDDGSAVVRYRRIDPVTGAVTASIDVSTLDAAGQPQATIWSGVFGSAIWRIGADLERVALANGSVTRFAVGPVWWSILAGIGTSGLWVLLPGDPNPNGREAALIHAEPGGADITTSASFPILMVRDTRSPERPALSALEVDAHGFSYRGRSPDSLDQPANPTWSYRPDPAP